MGRGRGKKDSKSDPKPGGRSDRKVVLEYSSDESLDKDNPQQVEGAGAPETCEEADTSDPANKSSPCDHN